MKKQGYSGKGFFGETNHYDNHANKVGESFDGFWGGSNHYGDGSADSCYLYEDEHDVIQREVVDEAVDVEEAIAWLEDNGYDPDDFDFD